MTTFSLTDGEGQANAARTEAEGVRIARAESHRYELVERGSHEWIVKQTWPGVQVRDMVSSRHSCQHMTSIHPSTAMLISAGLLATLSSQQGQTIN